MIEDNENLECEWGSSQPVHFAKATAYDSKGNEIITPKCKKCDIFMSRLIGKEAFCWYCTCCGGQ